MEEHAKLSASSSHRWLECPASIRMEQNFPDTSSSYAEEGNDAHQLAESCLRNGKNADLYIGKKMHYGHVVDIEMAESVQLYLDYVRNLSGQRFVEQKVDFSEWVSEGFGTADTIVMGQGKDEGIATVVDLKYGKGLKIDAEENSQAMLYGLGTLSDFGFIYEFDLVPLVIVQPRLDHISEWEIRTKHLIEWGFEVVKPKADIATRLLEDDVFFKEEGQKHFNPGEKQCQFCRAKANCRALAKYNLKIAAEEFKSIVTPIVTKDINQLGNEEIAALLPQLDLISTWINSVEAFALSELEHGRDIPGYKLVAGRSNRKWKNETEAEAALRGTKLKVSEIFIKKFVSPAQAEKLLGKKHPLLGELIIKPEGKPTIALNSDKRPALKSSVEDDFQKVA